MPSSATRARADDEPGPWLERDPIDRVRRFLEANGAWDRAWEEAEQQAASEEIEEAVRRAESLEVWDPAEIVDGMYAEPTAPLRRQRDDLLRDLGAS